MTIINDFIGMIEGPLVVNNKHGFVLNNGWRIFFKNTALTHKSAEALKRHYNKQNKTEVS